MSELLVYIAFVVGFALTPGPNMMLYLTYTFEYGRTAGWATALGIVSAFVVHISAISLGLAALLVKMPDALNILRYCGIAYLLYLAAVNLKTVKWSGNNAAIADNRLYTFFVKGFVGNLLNPGSLFLYFSILPQFIHTGNGPVFYQNLKLGGIQMFFSFLTNCSIIYLAGFATHIFKNERYQKWIRVVMSLFILLFALKLLLLPATISAT